MLPLLFLNKNLQKVFSEDESLENTITSGNNTFDGGFLLCFADDGGGDNDTISGVSQSGESEGEQPDTIIQPDTTGLSEDITVDEIDDSDTIPDFEDFYKEDTITEDTAIEADSLYDETLADTLFVPAYPEEDIPQKIHPDSVYTVKVDSTYFEKPDTVFPFYEPAVNYFGEHQLEKRNPVVLKETKDSNEWAFPFLIISLFLVAAARYSFYNRLKQIVYACVATRLFNQMDREGNLFQDRVSVMLFANFSLVFSMLAFHTLEYYSVLLIDFKQVSYSAVILVLFIITVFFFIIKYHILRFLGWVFKAINGAVAYFKNLIVCNMVIGLILLPIVLLYIFYPLNMFMYIGWGIFAIANIFKIARGVLIGYSITNFSAYYLILYLCAVELTPLLLITKLLANYIN